VGAGVGVSIGSGVSDGREAAVVGADVSVGMGGGVAGEEQEEREKMQRAENRMRVVVWRGIKGF
jgi:hypothetical protein